MNKKREDITTIRANAMIYKIGGGWGDSIIWYPSNQFTDEPKSHYTVMGHKTPRPKVRDLLDCHFQRTGWNQFIFTDVTYCENPPDMFFATVGFIKYEHEPTKT